LAFCAALTTVLSLAVSAPSARADEPAGIVAQAVCGTQIAFPTFRSFGECVDFVVRGGAVGVLLGSMQDEQIVFALVVQNGMVTHFAGINSSTICGFGTLGATTGETFVLTLAPGESDAVAIPPELSGIEVFRFRGDIEHARKGSFGLETAFNQHGGGTGC
jgi:hypothetical protein